MEDRGCLWHGRGDGDHTTGCRAGRQGRNDGTSTGELPDMKRTREAEEIDGNNGDNVPEHEFGWSRPMVTA